MRWTTAVICLTASVVLAAEPKDPKGLDVPAERTMVAKKLVAKLADADAGEREKAVRELAKMGREALPALLDARNGKPSDDLRAHLDDLLPDARKDDFDARAEVFLADKDRKYDHSLPGWDQLKAAAKDTKESRLLFADMLGDETCREMLLLAFDPTEAGRGRFEKRWEDKQREWQRVVKAEVRAGIKSNGPWPKADAPIHWMLGALLADLLCDRDYQSGYRHSIVNIYLTHTDEAKFALECKGRYGRVMNDFVQYWVEQQQGRFGMRDASSISRYMKFDKDVTLGREEKLFDLMVATGQGNGSVGHLAGTRDPKYVDSFRRLFELDKPYSAARNDSKLPEIQMRDVGLSMCIALSGQDPSEYGFTAQLKTKATDDMRYYPTNYYFEAGGGKTVEEKRKAAFAQWAAWEKANPDKLKAKTPDKK